MSDDNLHIATEKYVLNDDTVELWLIIMQTGYLAIKAHPVLGYELSCVI